MAIDKKAVGASLVFIACMGFNYFLNMNYNEKHALAIKEYKNYETQIERLNTSIATSSKQSVVDTAKDKIEDMKLLSAKGEIVSAYQLDRTMGNFSKASTLEKKLDTLFLNQGQDHKDTWFTGNMNETYFWNFSFSRDISLEKLPCVWLCTNKKGEVLAYAKAKYDSELDCFVELKVGLTMNGTSDLSVTQVDND